MNVPTTVEVAILGSGSAASALVRELGPGGPSIAVFEPDLVGGECPFHACIPSKSLLHDARVGTEWKAAAERRDELVHHLDDTAHADQLTDAGAMLVRARATIDGPGALTAGGAKYHAEHIVLATGAQPMMPDVDGLEDCADRVWTSDDALVATERPAHLVVVGGGVIGVECAFVFAGFGSEVVLVDNAERCLDVAPPRVSEIIEQQLRDRGVEIRSGVEATEYVRRDDGVEIALDDGTTVAGDRVLLAVGRKPNTTGIGLERLGLDPQEPLPLERNGRVRCDGSVWAIGDVAGLEQYTHLANHHGAVVADHLAGTGTRTFDDVVVPACVFSSPPVCMVGDDHAELDGDEDIVSTGRELASFARTSTDELADGYLWVAARRSSGCLAAAAGVGPRFDELVHALVVAIDGRVPVARLRQSMRPFPTVGEILDPILDDLHHQLTA